MSRWEVTSVPEAHLPSEDGQLDGTSPLLGIQNPLPVLCIALAQEPIIVGEGVCCHCIRYYPPAHH